MPPDECDGDGELPQFNVSYKPQVGRLTGV